AVDARTHRSSLSPYTTLFRSGGSVTERPKVEKCATGAEPTDFPGAFPLTLRWRRERRIKHAAQTRRARRHRLRRLQISREEQPAQFGRGHRLDIRPPAIAR